MAYTQSKLSKICENIFEMLLWKSRLIVLLAVIFGLLGAFGLFVLGSCEIYKTIVHIFPLKLQAEGYDDVLIGVVGAIDLFLIGIVLLIFSFGVYELFVSKIDEARLHSKASILDIETLDELKNKVLKLIVVVLIVSLFKSSLHIRYSTPLDILYFGFSVLAVSLAVYFIHKREEGD